MADYAKRTCSQCGIRKPQPDMYQQEVYTETGKSKAGVSGATWAGLLLGDTKSVNSINRWLFNTNQRTYKRKKLVWLCARCSGHIFADRGPTFEKFKRILKSIFWIGMIILFTVGLLSS
jgi:hypothetical protein